jgi:hypothetical protein
MDNLELMYKEKTRLSEVVNSYAVSSFNDFKMLSALSAVIVAWKPISESMNTSANALGSLLIGFLVINVTITLIGLLNLLKQSVMNFYLDEIQILENEIRSKLTDTETFQVTSNWNSKGKYRQLKVSTTFYRLFSLVTIILPTVILIYSSLSGCDFRMIYVDNDKEKEKIVEQFQSVFDSKKKDCDLLVVHSASSPKKWTIAGFNEERLFKRLVIDDPSSELSEELKKEPNSMDKIVKLVTSKLSLTRSTCTWIYPLIYIILASLLSHLYFKTSELVNAR